MELLNNESAQLEELSKQYHQCKHDGILRRIDNDYFQSFYECDKCFHVCHKSECEELHNAYVKYRD